MAREQIDFVLNDRGDLHIQNGDFVWDESTEQNIEDLLVAHSGDFREFPFLGVGLSRFLKDDGSKAELIQLINKMADLDGLRITKLQVENQLIINGSYKG